MNKLAVVIMAAGKGTRMENPNKPKVMFGLNDKPLLGYVIELSKKLNPEKIISIIGFKKEEVKEYLKNNFENILIAIQEPQLGTGHAVMQTENELINFNGDVLILSGDVPLLKYETINNLISVHRNEKATATILTAELSDATGYGRIVRNSKNEVTNIIEHKDASDEIRKINEINTGIYLFKSDVLFNYLKKINDNNAQKEYYLTDVFKFLFSDGKKICAVIATDFNEVSGINTVKQLKEAEVYLNSI